MEDFPWGGSEELWYRAAIEAAERGCHVCTITKKWDPTPDKIVELQSLNVETQFFFNRKRTLVKRILKYLGLSNGKDYVFPKLNADFIILSQGGTFDIFYRKQIIDDIVKSGIPYLIISQHNYENGGVIDDNIRSSGLKFINNSNKFCFVSKRNLETAERQVAFKITNSALLSNPVNLNKIGIKKYNESSKLLMACVARLDCNFKGQDILLQVLSDNKWKLRDYELKLYGSGSHERFLKELVSFYELEDKVFFMGHVNFIDQIWHQNQILILPSISEGTSLALMEAMLCGRTALATDVGDTGVYVIDKETGFLVNSPSYSCLNQALDDLWDNKHKLESLGIKAFEHALKITDLKPEKTLIDFLQR